jgi:tRNA (guanine-N7-)-methyltransferase
MTYKKSSANSSGKQKQKRVFVRRAGKKLNTGRANALKNLLPKLTLSDDDIALPKALAPASLFPNALDEYCMEIGFGTGEHLATLTQLNQNIGYIGVEPFSNGMATFLRDIKDHSHHNIRVFMDDAMLVAEALSDESLDRIYILNPDPWHKTRHHKRRMIQHKNLDHFARILKPGGQLISSTDVPYLAEWIVTQTCTHGAFEWRANSAKDWKIRPDGWPDHSYATKGAKGASEMHYLIFDKIL